MNESVQFSKLAELETKYEDVDWNTAINVYKSIDFDRLKELKRRWDLASSLNVETSKIPEWENITLCELEYHPWKKTKHILYWECRTDHYEQFQKRQYITKHIPECFIPSFSVEEVAHHILSSTDDRSAKKYKYNYYRLEDQIEFNVQFRGMRLGGYRNFKRQPLTIYKKIGLASLYIEMAKLGAKYDDLYRKNPEILDPTEPWGSPNIFLQILISDTENEPVEKTDFIKLEA